MLFCIFVAMKLFTSSLIKEHDNYTIAHEPIASIDLMERAATAITAAICKLWKPEKQVVVFAGAGNNGGDALAVARMLGKQDYKVHVYLFNIHGKLSDNCATNKQRLEECKAAETFVEVTNNFDPPLLDEHTLVVDGLFGAGISKPLTGGFAALVKYINQSPATVVSIDLPSGLMPEDNTYNIKSNIVRAHVTLTLQYKKICMFLADNQPYLGKVEVLDIGLSDTFVKETPTHIHLLEAGDLRPQLRPRDAFAHKGDMGHALIIAGSYGMCGAAILATQACLRSGVGKVTVTAPMANVMPLQTAVPEAVLSIQPDERYFSEPLDTEPFDAIAIGPGIGTLESTAIALIAQLRRAGCPIVADADALNILASHKAWLQQVPHGIIMTPHPKEFDRMAGSVSNGCYERLMRAKEMAQHNACYVVLKGHHTAICLPDGNIFFNATGNAGMATAGAGDVLTGVITGLLARGYTPEEAVKLGVYLHGLAGDLAADSLGQESLVASDIVRFLPKAFSELLHPIPTSSQK